MARKPKRKGRKPPRPADTPVPFSDFCVEHPEGFHVTLIPELRDSGVPIEGIISEPKRLKQDLNLIEMGKAIGRHQRNRSSDTEIIRRNVEICDLRKADPKKWSHAMLGRKYDLTRQAIHKILKEEAGWRRKLAGLPTN